MSLRTRGLLFGVTAALAIGVVIGLGGAPKSNPLRASQAPSGGGIAVAPNDRSFLVTAEDLRARRAQAVAGVEPFRDAFDDLLQWARTATNTAPRPLQPLVVTDNDNELTDDATRAYGLSIAYAATGSEEYAVAARATIRAWVDKVQWTEDTCPDSGGCHTSLVIGRVGAGFPFAADLIAGSPSWTSDDRAALQAWLRKVLLPGASTRPNNWGDAGTFARVAIADYLDDDKAFDDAIGTWRSLLDLIEPDGRIPEEVRRGTAGISYTQEALGYKIAVARIAERRGLNLWDAVGAKGGSLRAAIDRLAYYWTRPNEWPDATNPEVPVAGPAWEIAYAHWHDPIWIPIVESSRPYGDRGHSALVFTTLTNGIPIDRTVAVGSPSVSPSPSASPSASAAPGSAPPLAALTGLTARLVRSAALGDVATNLAWTGSSGDRVQVESSTGDQWRSVVDRSGTSGSTIVRRAPGSVAYRARPVGAAGPGPWLQLDGVTTARVDAGSRSLTVTGSWAAAGLAGYSGGTAFSTKQVGATATWRGRISDLLLIGPVGPTRGRFDLIVDGKVVQTVTEHARTFVARTVLAQLHWSTTGDHTITIRTRSSSGGSTVAIDDLVTLATGSLSQPGS
jgi:hypothetical protein